MLAILASACAWLAGSAVRGLSPIEPADAAPLSPLPTGLLTDRRSARIVGAAYLREIDDAEASAERLMRAILVDRAGAMGTDELNRVILARIRRDFILGAVVMVDGWMLSQTEAALCALEGGLIGSSFLIPTQSAH